MKRLNIPDLDVEIGDRIRLHHSNNYCRYKASWGEPERVVARILHRWVTVCTHLSCSGYYQPKVALYSFTAQWLFALIRMF